jgi:hypothetical protein
MLRILASSATIIVTIVVPVIVEVKPIAGGKVHIRANTPVTISGNLSNCTKSLKEMPLDVVCDASGEITVTPI